MTTVPDQRRAQIIDAARAIIEQNGTGKLTAAAVAASVGVSRPLLYHYFANMDELTEEIISQYVNEFQVRFDAWYDEHAADALDEGLCSCADFLFRELEHTCPWGIDEPTVGPDGRMRPTYQARCSQIVSQSLAGGTGALSDAIRERVPHPEKTMRVLVLGLAQYQHTQPGTEAEEIRQIVSEGFGFGQAERSTAAKAPAITEAVQAEQAEEQAPVATGAASTTAAASATKTEAPAARKRGFFDRFRANRD